ncbi:MAG TPA: ABC transporter substrate-binding protein [Candidatus Acidoferrales bacterium]|nr:ABC transporter substrate-binding protein [Candidatus Acidoferrales bacterium]
MRVVSLLASGTEIVCGLGAGASLVGRSHECDNPHWVTSLPACTKPAFDINVSSGEIDAEVRRRLKLGQPLYHIDTNLINALQPDLLITQAHCDVCAVTPEDLRREGCIVAEQVVSLQAGTIDGIYEGVTSVGRALGAQREMSQLIQGIERRIDSVRRAVQRERAPSVVVLEWIDPLFTAGNWGPELVQAANGDLLLSGIGQYSQTHSWEELRSADPEYLIVAPCGFSLERTASEARSLELLPGWFQLRAVKERKVALADGNLYFNRSGPTVADTAEILAEILHRRGACYRGAAWRPYEVSSIAAAIERVHADACARRSATYADPATGFEVMTSFFLRERGFCCGNGCRHCPYSSVERGVRAEMSGA